MDYKYRYEFLADLDAMARLASLMPKTTGEGIRILRHASNHIKARVDAEHNRALNQYTTRLYAKLVLLLALWAYSPVPPPPPQTQVEADHQLQRLDFDQRLRLTKANQVDSGASAHCEPDGFCTITFQSKESK